MTVVYMHTNTVTGTNYTNLTEVARGLRPTSGGFRWRYLEVDCDE